MEHSTIFFSKAFCPCPTAYSPQIPRNFTLTSYGTLFLLNTCFQRNCLILLPSFSYPSRIHMHVGTGNTIWETLPSILQTYYLPNNILGTLKYFEYAFVQFHCPKCDIIMNNHFVTHYTILMKGSSFHSNKHCIYKMVLHLTPASDSAFKDDSGAYLEVV